MDKLGSFGSISEEERTFLPFSFSLLVSSALRHHAGSPRNNISGIERNFQEEGFSHLTYCQHLVGHEPLSTAGNGQPAALGPDPGSEAVIPGS